jgi:hypothetical protein
MVIANNPCEYNHEYKSPVERWAMKNLLGLDCATAETLSSSNKPL